MSLKSSLLKVLLSVFVVVSFVSTARAAAPDGSGPWADEVVTSNQGLTKDNNPVLAIRSDTSQALGVAEETDVDGTFYSLGFGGEIILRFDNGISSGVVVVESTRTVPNFPFYPEETAQVRVSDDGSTWYLAGNVSQDGTVGLPDQVSCIQYVEIKDTSDESLFEDTADGYDLDGVKAQGEPCDPPASPTLTPPPATPTLTPPPATVPPSSPPGPPGPPVCSATTPDSPTITSATKTSPTTVELTWTAVSPVTHYTISYGTSPGNYQFGVPNTGNTTSFVVGGLDPNTTYYFVVYAVNDCAPSEPSNEVSPGGTVLGAATGQVLGATTDTLAQAGENRLALRLLVTSLAVFATFLLGTRLLPKNEEN